MSYTLKDDPEYETKSNFFDKLWLLKLFKIVTAGVDSNANLALVLHEQIIDFLTFGKGKTKQKTNIWCVLTPNRRV